jgi:bifunctional non-homologous end joining protein LigD
LTRVATAGRYRQHEPMRPMLATAGAPPIGAEWLYEVKWDGMRVLADVRDREVRLFSRSERDVTVGFPELAALGSVIQDGMVDGEIIALSDGLPSFTALAERMQVADARRANALAEQLPVTVMCFDLLRLYGVDLLGRPLTERRASLANLGLPQRNWQLSPSYDDGAVLYSATREQGLEGIVAKRLNSPYQPGRRSPDWVKSAHRKDQACVVGGWRPETSSPAAIGALLIGVPDGSGGLAFAGRVGSGIGRRHSQDLLRSLAPLARAGSPFSSVVPAIDAAGARWCDPSVVVEVRHLGWTPANRLRQPVFRGLRPDLRPDGVRRES